MARGADAGLDREKSKKIGPLKALGPFMAPYRWMVLGALAALISTASLSLILPLAVRRVVDGFAEESSALMDQYFSAAIAVAGLLAVATAIRYWLVTRLGERVIADIRKAVYDKVIGMSPAFFERVMTGEVISRLTTDTTLILSVISSSVSVALRNVLMFFGGMALMFWTSPKLAGFAFLIVPLVVLPILILGRRVRRLSRESQDRVADSSAQASETLQAAQTVQAYTAEGASRARFGLLTEQSYDAARKRITIRAAMTAIVIFLVFTGVVGVLWIGAQDVREDIMTPGELAQFLIYAVIVAGAVGALSEIWGELQRAAGATERLVELLNAEDPVAAAETPTPLPAKAQGAIEFQTVNFRYPARPAIVALDNFDLTVRPGETVALVGPSGAGKTTVLDLICGKTKATSGSIKFLNVELTKKSEHEIVRAGVGRKFQTPSIYENLTVLENLEVSYPEGRGIFGSLLFKRTPKVMEKIHEIANEIMLDDALDMPAGLLSHGQKQWLEIGMLLIQDPQLLMLDEPVAGMSVKEREQTAVLLNKISQGRSVLVIEHDMEFVERIAHKVTVLHQGKILAAGDMHKVQHDPKVVEVYLGH